MVLISPRAPVKNLRRMVGVVSYTPHHFDQWNRALRGAYTKGFRHAQHGGSQVDCPYRDKRKRAGQLTWSRAFINAWNDGYRDYAYHPNHILLSTQNPEKL